MKPKKKISIKQKKRSVKPKKPSKKKAPSRNSVGSKRESILGCVWCLIKISYIQIEVFTTYFWRKFKIEIGDQIEIFWSMEKTRKSICLQLIIQMSLKKTFTTFNISLNPNDIHSLRESIILINFIWMAIPVQSYDWMVSWHKFVS